jgi:hypothetical protein
LARLAAGGWVLANQLKIRRSAVLSSIAGTKLPISAG